MIKYKKYFTPSEWVTQLIKESKKNWDDTHFDIFKNYNNSQGLELLQYACQVLIEARDAIKLLKNIDRPFMPLVRLPLGSHETFKHWDDLYWDKLGANNDESWYEPPTLYILSEKGSFLVPNLENEEYRCPIPLPLDFSVELKNKITPLFVCCRSDLESEEFYLDLFLYFKGDF